MRRRRHACMRMREGRCRLCRRRCDGNGGSPRSTTTNDQRNNEIKGGGGRRRPCRLPSLNLLEIEEHVGPVWCLSIVIVIMFRSVAFDVDVIISGGGGWEDGIITVTTAELVVLFLEPSIVVLCFLMMFVSILLSISFSSLLVLPEVIIPRYCLLAFVIVLYSVIFFQDSLSSQSY